MDMAREARQSVWDKWMSIRPLSLFVLCFLIGIIIGRAAPEGLFMWLIGSAAALGLLIVFRKRAFAFSLALLLGACWVVPFTVKPLPMDEKSISLTGQVDGEVRLLENGTRVRLKNVELNGEKYAAKVMLYIYCEAPELAYGDTVSATVSVHLPKEAGNPGGFDYAAWMWRQGASLVANVSAKGEVTVEKDTSFSPLRWAQMRRAAISEVIKAIYDDDCEGIALALIVGDKSEIPAEIRENYQKAGVSHLLALSGLHVGALFLLMNWVFCRLRVNKKAAFALTMVLTGLYALLVGAPASILRAALMYAVLCIGRFSGRPNDRLTNVCTALFVLLLIDPLYVTDVGFLLSFTAVGGLALFDAGWVKPIGDEPERYSRLAYRLYPVKKAVRAGLAAQLGTIPVMACAFNQFPVWFLLFNVILIPLMSCVFPLIMVSVAAGYIFMPLGQALAWIAAWFVRLFSWVTGLGAHLPYAMISSADWPVWLCVLYAASALAASPYLSGRAVKIRRIAALVVMVLLIVVGVKLPDVKNWLHSGLTVTFLDVGQGDAAVIHAGRNYYMVDVGKDSTACDYLIDQGIVPEGIFLSHGHSDHAGGLGEIVKSFEPGTLYVPCLWSEDALDPDVKEAWDAAMAAGWTAVYLKTGDEIELSDSVIARVWNPEGETIGDSSDNNENCMVLSVGFGRSEALFTGDLPMNCEWIPLPDCTVLKVGHHGSAGSTGRLLLEQVTPEVAVISVGRNTYGHPTEAVLQKLSASSVYRTDECGAITVVMEENGETRVTTWRVKEDS